MMMNQRITIQALLLAMLIDASAANEHQMLRRRARATIGSSYGPSISDPYAMVGGERETIPAEPQPCILATNDHDTDVNVDVDVDGGSPNTVNNDVDPDVRGNGEGEDIIVDDVQAPSDTTEDTSGQSPNQAKIINGEAAEEDNGIDPYQAETVDNEVGEEDPGLSPFQAEIVDNEAAEDNGLSPYKPISNVGETAEEVDSTPLAVTETTVGTGRDAIPFVPGREEVVVTPAAEGSDMSLNIVVADAANFKEQEQGSDPLVPVEAESETSEAGEVIPLAVVESEITSDNESSASSGALPLAPSSSTSSSANAEDAAPLVAEQSETNTGNEAEALPYAVEEDVTNRVDDVVPLTVADAQTEALGAQVEDIDPNAAVVQETETDIADNVAPLAAVETEAEATEEDDLNPNAPVTGDSSGVTEEEGTPLSPCRTTQDAVDAAMPAIPAVPAITVTPRYGGLRRNLAEQRKVSFTMGIITNRF